MAERASQNKMTSPERRTHIQKPFYGSSFTPAHTLYPLQGLTHAPKTIEWLWRLFNALPKAKPRLRRTQNAAGRVLDRRGKPRLPPRRAYQTTVDYYEAYLPLFAARRRFMLTEQGALMTMAAQACKTILPTTLF